MLEKENIKQELDKLVEVKCNLCGKEKFTFLFEGHDYLSFSPLAFKVVQCSSCGLVSLNPRPENMLPYYKEYHKFTLEKDVFCFLSPDRVKKIKKFKRGGRVLDIGCGRGNFLFEMSQEGWEVYGNDISPLACDYARKELGLDNISTGELLSLHFPESYFDVVTFWHVLEHLEKPRETLNKIHRMLKEDGLLIIESPDFSSPQSRFFKDKWQALELPRHLYHFSGKTLRKLLQATGFRVIKKDYRVDARISFMSLKISLLRWLGLDRIPEKGQLKELAISLHFQERKILWRFTRFIFNWMCLGVSQFLNLLNCKDMFRVYCCKMKRS